jgi:hypothetical protein
VKLRRSCLAALGVAALAVPAAAVAHPGHGHANGHGKNHPVTYVFKGAYDGNGLVNVTHGNHHARQANLVGNGDVQFDLTNTRLSVADTDNSGVIDVNDVLNEDAVVVKARLPRQDPDSTSIAAKHLVDQTNPADPDSSDTSDSVDDTSD